jgi:hypothetical protein
MVRGGRRGPPQGGRRRLRNDGAPRIKREGWLFDFVHAYLLSDVAPFLLALWRASAGRVRNRTVDKDTGTIRAFGPTGGGEVQIHPWVAERAAAAVTSRDHLVDVDGF